MSGVINCVAYAGGRRIADVEIEDISDILKQEDRFIWIELHEPSEALLQQVQVDGVILSYHTIEYPLTSPRRGQASGDASQSPVQRHIPPAGPRPR
jgi:hypothetical protein